MLLNVDKLKDKARKFEQKDQNEKAIDVYLTIVQQLEGRPQMDHELAIYNKVGDLYLKTNNVNAAVDMYDRAAHRYIDSGFPNNAIALCNKILRNAPGRTETYLMLAELMLQRGFAAEAKQHFIEYAERMSKAGRVVQAFKALKKFADASPQNEDVRNMLLERLEAARQQSSGNVELEALYQEMTGEGRADAQADLKDGARGRKGSSDLVFIDLDDDGESGESAADAPAPEFESTALVDEPDMPEGDLEIEHTTMDSALDGGGLDTLKGLESSTEFEGSVEPPPVESSVLDDGVTSDGLEAEPLRDELQLIQPPDAPPEPQIVLPDPATSDAGTVDLPELDVPDLDLGGFDESVESVVPLEEAPTGVGEVSVERESAPDLGFGDMSPAELQISGTIDGEAGPDLEDLEAQVALNPDDAEAHRNLAELLLERGERDRGLDELDAAVQLMESGENWGGALAVTEEIIRLDPNSVAHHQKRVEYAYRLGQQSKLVPAYLDLADALFRSGVMDQARSVFERVLELDPDNASAKQSIESIMPVESGPAVPRAPTPAPTPADTRVGAGRGTQGFVDLGDFILGPDDQAKSTRMLGRDEQSGDEQRDFEVMLSQFKRGIEQNIDDTDAPAHYDLGVAFKEMGLLDEAIAEFQKSLRSPETRLRSAEALGGCFYEKGQFQVAATVMRRAVDSDPGGDDAKIGLLYWLGRCEEEQASIPSALAYYQRVFAVDINFQDVGQRVAALAEAGR